jgi:hypothetical protein
MSASEDFDGLYLASRDRLAALGQQESDDPEEAIPT